jgi:hypothetical protein
MVNAMSQPISIEVDGWNTLIFYVVLLLLFNRVVETSLSSFLFSFFLFEITNSFLQNENLALEHQNWKMDFIY